MNKGYSGPSLYRELTSALGLSHSFGRREETTLFIRAFSEAALGMLNLLKDVYAVSVTYICWKG